MYFRLFLVAFASFGLVSCGGIWGIEGDLFEKTNKVGVILAQTDKSVNNFDGESLLSAAAGLASQATAEKDSSSTVNEVNYTQLMETTVSTLESEFGGLGKFTFTPANNLMNTSDYKAYITTLDAANKEIGSDGVDSFSGLYYKNSKPIQGAAIGPEAMITTESADKYRATVRAAFKKLAQAQGLDGFVIVKVDLGYKPYTALMGTGVAAPAANITMLFINPDGDFAANGMFVSLEEDNTVPMAAGGVLLNKELSDGLNTAIANGVKYMANDMKENKL